MTAMQGENSITTMPREMRKQSIARSEGIAATAILFPCSVKPSDFVAICSSVEGFIRRDRRTKLAVAQRRGD
jgi:hypothetical protein